MYKESEFRNFFVIFYGLLFLISRSVAAEGKLSDFMPSISIGEKWTVEVKMMTDPPGISKEALVEWRAEEYSLEYLLVAEELKDIDDEKCYSIRIEIQKIDEEKVQKPAKYFRIYLRSADFTLKKLERLSSETNEVEASRIFKHGPVDASESVSSLPLPFPYFPEETDIQEATRKSSQGDVDVHFGGRYRQTQEVVQMQIDGKEREVLKVTLYSAIIPSQPILTTVIFDRGKPWWTEVTVERGGKYWCSARLLKAPLDQSLSE